ncbi:MAG: metallophosphoesterase [Verrucomicrobia bacterium]|nr:metallophosphoesterase [Verrucomicrobiota bacterium]
MTTRIAVLADLHFAGGCPLPKRRGEIADILLLRVVHRLNRLIRPDVTLILGDLIDGPDGPDAEARLRRLQDIIRLINSPVIAIPGNHDGDPERFHRIFGPPLRWLDIQGVRFVPFLDREEPGYNASRSAADLERMRRARAEHAGPIVALQHTSIFPPGLHKCPYNYANADQVIARMKETGVSLAVSGHYHAGFEIEKDGARFLAAPALCEAPFPFLEITLAGDRIETIRHELQLPRSLGLADLHSHTQFAYCSANMDMTKSIRLAEEFGLAGIAFTEHSGQLYFNNEDYWAGRYFETGVEGAIPSHNRMEDYLQSAAAVQRSNLRIGLEADCDRRGKPVLKTEDRARVQLIIGAIHVLPQTPVPPANLERACDAFLALQERFVKTGLAILAHPFRAFQRDGLTTPESLFSPTIRMLKENRVAAELNFHTNAPEPEFFRRCIEARVRIAFGSDAHNLYEVGEFAPHLQFLKEIGFNGELKDVLANPVNL